MEVRNIRFNVTVAIIAIALWSKTRKNTDKIGSERSERASERVSAAEGASEASSLEQANE